ncbi:helix-turn-helix domain-containing protein [Streptomyces sp. S.PNR 29]|uniref:helix-turn-helix domain-containing protein n=1 Tax=Streptomyces sp. S.PNR 29 TaxID=2973805 RepID=UPI0025B27120|nr:helix-turn-helix domain-containing protein [Streptomyces sp. S.PNR 29]MDN0196581.1 helix-turn-helix domain-containing protein [Streptomyces sp. S.PNR 29]
MSKTSVWDRRTWGAIREVKGITYRQIAEACDVYEGTPEKWFNSNSANRNPKLKHQITMAKILGIPLRTLLSEIKDPGVRAAIRAAYDD